MNKEKVLKLCLDCLDIHYFDGEIKDEVEIARNWLCEYCHDFTNVDGEVIHQDETDEL